MGGIERCLKKDRVNEGTHGAEEETRKLTNAHSYPNSMVMNTDESCKH